MKKIAIVLLLSVIWLQLIRKSSNEANGNFYFIMKDKDISELIPFDVFNVNNNPAGCMLKCNRQDVCDAATASGNLCSLYAIQRDNFCPTNYTLTDSLNTQTFVKAKRTNKKKCKQSAECYTEYGLNCVNQMCQCNHTQ